MGVGEVYTVDGCPDIHYVDTGMYDTAEYGAVYVIDAENPAIVDTGIGTHVDRILAALDTVGIERAAVEVIAPTHVHLDHAGGAGFLADACPNATVYIHEIGASHLVDPDRLVAGTKDAVGDQWQYYTDPKPVPEPRVSALTDGDTIDLGDRNLDVYHTPGHAPHQVVYHDTRADAVFTADAAGIYIPTIEELVETTPPPNFDFDQCLDDVDTIQAIDPNQLLYPHFGPAPTTALDAYPAVLTEWVDHIETLWNRYEDRAAVVDALEPDQDRVRVWGLEKTRAENRMNARGVLTALDTSE